MWFLPCEAGEGDHAERVVEGADASTGFDAKASSCVAAVTLPEVILWQELRRGRLKELQFRRQHPVGLYILDFFCAAARLAVEIDGSSHDNERQFLHDERRTSWLAEHNIQVLRIPAAAVLRDESLGDVLACIEQAAAPSTAFGGPSPP